jgi:uncharacterized protein (TIGR00730 family)
MKNIVYEILKLIQLCFMTPFYFIRGIWALYRLQQPIITIFGGKRAKPDNGYAKQAYQLAFLLGKNNCSIITGGGPGIMDAANCGAQEAHKNFKRWTLGLTVSGVDDDYVPPCARNIQTKYFFVRKWLLMRYSANFVIFPGGIGTAEELFELLDLKKHGMVETTPIILMDREYWKPLLTWYVEKGIREGFITMPLHNAFITCNTVEEAIAVIQQNTTHQ